MGLKPTRGSVLISDSQLNWECILRSFVISSITYTGLYSYHDMFIKTDENWISSKMKRQS